MEGRDQNIVVDVLVAVVDQIALPNQKILHRAGMNLKDLSGIKPRGMEGISFSIADSMFTAPDLWSSKSDSETLKDQASDETGILSFELQGKEATSPLDTTLLDEEPSLSYTLNLPLSNTTFRNGLSSTFFAQRWQVGLRADDGFEMTCIRDRKLVHQRLRLPRLSRLPLIDSRPWCYLTPPRIVAQCAGNVVRSLEKGDGQDDSLPASGELEAAVSSLLASKQSTSNHFEIWAQITPRESCPNQPRMWHGMERAAAHGDRFHKVLSGGGGWGEKKGLIALDPDSTFHHTSPDPSQPLQFPFDQVISPGDVVRFIGIWYKDLTNHYSFNKSAEGPDGLVFVDGARCLRFGSALPTMNVESKVADKRILVLCNQFGALSEQGSSLSIDVHLKERGSFGCQKLGNIVTTKLPPLFDLSYYDTYTKVRTQPKVRRVATPGLTVS